MSKIVFSLLLLLYSSVVYSFTVDSIDDKYTPMQLNQLFDQDHEYDMKELVDLVDKEEQINRCMDDYITRQSKSFSKVIQNNLYDLIENFNRVNSKIQGKGTPTDNISYEDKREVLARIQCETYYAIGILK